MSIENEIVKQHMGKLGLNYQTKLVYELLLPNNINENTKNIFFEEIIRYLEPSYFETMDMRRIMVLIKDYYKKYNNIPNIDNIYTLTETEISNDIEKKEIEARLISIRNLGVKYKSGEINEDRKFVKEQALTFVKQQEFLKANRESTEKLEKGIVDESTIIALSERYKAIIDIGQPQRHGKDIFESIDEVLSEDSRRPIGTGIKEIDNKVNGGIDRGEFALILASPGIGKSTMLSLIAANNYMLGKNVLHIILEGKENDIRRKIYAKVLGIPSSQLSKQKEKAKSRIEDLKKSPVVGKLKIVRLSDDTTPTKLKKFIKKEEDKRGKIDLVVLDYIDCLEPDDRGNDKWFGQEQVVKKVESLCEELDIAMYAAIQAKKEANNVRLLDMNHCGGSVERLKKAHMVISLGRDINQLNNNQINIVINKCRFARAGWVWEDILFNNDTLDIKIDDSHHANFNEDLVIKEDNNIRIDDSAFKKINSEESIDSFEKNTTIIDKLSLIE